MMELHVLLTFGAYACDRFELERPLLCRILATELRCFVELSLCRHRVMRSFIPQVCSNRGGKVEGAGEVFFSKTRGWVTGC